MLQAQAEAATVGDESDAAMVQLQAKIRARRDEAKRQKKVRTAGLEPQLYALNQSSIAYAAVCTAACCGATSVCNCTVGAHSMHISSHS
jgi:hypothetical protein